MGCAPCFNTMQTARMLLPKKIEMIPNYTWFGDLSKEIEWKQYNCGCRLCIGLTKKINLYGHYEMIDFGEKDHEKYWHWSKINFVELGLKLKMTKPDSNKTLAALYLPIGTYFGVKTNKIDKIEYIQIQPTMILTRPITKRVDLSGSTVVVVSKMHDRKVNILFVAQNIGLDVNIYRNRLSVRPEIGIGIGISMEDPIYQFSIGFSYAPSGYAE